MRRLKYTVSRSRKIYVEDRLEGEIFYAQEFDDSVTPPDVGFKTVSDQVDRWAEELTPKPSSDVAPATQEPEPSKPTKPTARTIEDVTKVFPQNIAGLLYFEDAGDKILIKPRHYLDTEVFRQVSDIVHEFQGGEYVSAGKDSHWRIMKPEAPRIGFIDEPKTPKMPEFNPEVLMNWSWKGRKRDDGTYAPGSVSYGWDFADNFPKSVIQVLEKGPQIIDQYVFTLDKFGDTTVVHARKKKDED